MHKPSTQLKRAGGSTLVQFISAREIHQKQSMPTYKHSMPNLRTSKQRLNAACFATKLVTLSAISQPQGLLSMRTQRTKSATNSWKFSLDLQRVKPMSLKHRKGFHPHSLKDHKWHKKQSHCLVKAELNFMPEPILRQTIMFNRSPYGAPSSKTMDRTPTIGEDSHVHSKMQVT